MANYPTCALVCDDDGRGCIVAVTSGRPDQMPGCYYTLHDPESGNIVGHGFSRGWSGDGAGSFLSAMKIGKAAAKRWLRRRDER